MSPVKSAFVIHIHLTMAGKKRLALVKPKQPKPQQVTIREKEVIGLLHKGKSHKQIGGELNISTRTVSKHIQHIYEKLGVSSKGEVFEKLALDQQPVHPPSV